MTATHNILHKLSLGAGLLVVATLMSVEQKTFAAEPADPVHAAHAAAAASQAGGQTVEAQLAEMLARIQRLEARAQQQSGSTSGAMPMNGTPGMAPSTKPTQGQMDGMSAMGAGDPATGGAPGTMKPTGGMGGMGGAASPPGGQIGMMSMMDKMMGMMDKMMSMGGGAMPAGAPATGISGDGGTGMAKMDMAGKSGAAGAASATIPSDLPGFPGASNIYHVGATGFFLDQPKAIKLTADQQAALNAIKGKSIGDLGAAQLRIDQVEQEIWMLTGTDRPDSTVLETRLREIERLKSDQRIAFIRSVGEAARVLTNEQRAGLLGTGAPGAAPMTAPQGSAGSVAPMQGGMAPPDPKAGMAGMGGDPMGNRARGKPPNAMGKGKMEGM